MTTARWKGFAALVMGKLREAAGEGTDSAAGAGMCQSWHLTHSLSTDPDLHLRHTTTLVRFPSSMSVGSWTVMYNMHHTSHGHARQQTELQACLRPYKLC